MQPPALDPELGSLETWMIRRANLDERAFGRERIGPYRLGRRVRQTAFGEVVLALHDSIEVVLELDFLAELQGNPITAPDGRLMNDLAQVVGLRHRHIAPMVGSGFADGVPYVVRPHRPGRTLAAVAQSSAPLDRETAVGVLFGVAEALAHLAEQGAKPGACSMGGFDNRDVLLGFDGSVALVGLGLQLPRGAPDPLAADLDSCTDLAQWLDLVSGGSLAAAIARATGLAEVARIVRHHDPSACAKRQTHVALALRRAFEDAIQEERAFFGLPTLQ